MIDNTLQTISQTLSTTLNKSSLTSKVIEDVYSFLFNNPSNQTQKYLQYIGLLFLLKKSISWSITLGNYIWEGVKYVDSRAGFDPPEFKDRFGVKYWTLIIGADN